MFRHSVWFCLVLLCGAEPAPRPQPPAKGGALGTPGEQCTTAHVRELLNKAIQIEKDFGENVQLKDALNYVAQKSGLRLVVNQRAFENDQQIKEIEIQPVRLGPPGSLVTASALRMILEQVNGAWLIRPGYLEITTFERTQPEVWHQLSLEERRTVPTVDVKFDKRPLAEALRQTAEASGINVVLDGRVSDPTKQLVTADLQEVPVDTAVRLMADMCGLQVVGLDNVIYVTSPENAKALRTAVPQRCLVDPPFLFGWGRAHAWYARTKVKPWQQGAIKGAAGSPERGPEAGKRK
jgi:hypothetical protein